MQVVDVDLVLDGVVAEVVGGAVARCPRFTPPPASHMVKPCGLWSRPSSPCAVGVRPNSPPHEHQRVLQQAARLQVRQQAGDRLVDLAGVLGVVLLAGRRAGPTCTLCVHLDEAHAALGEPAGQQALPAEVVGRPGRPGRRARSVACDLAGRCPAPRAPSVCMRKASSNESMRPSSAASGPVALEVLAVHLARAGRAAAAASSRRASAFAM